MTRGPGGFLEIVDRLLATDNRGDARRFIAHFSPPFLIGYDPAGKTAEAFHVEGMPSSFLISSTGTILFSHVGFDSKDAAKIEAQIKKALIQ